MQTIKSLIAALLLAAGATANAGMITEAYTGSQTVDRGDSYTFDFDLWYKNGGLVSDNAPDMKLTTDGEGAFGNWSSATLYIDLSSSDSESETAWIDFEAWTFRLLGIPFGGTDVLSLNNITFSRPTPSGDTSLHLTYILSPLQVGLLDNYGGGYLQIGASGFRSDFDLTRVALVVTTGAVPEPGTLALIAAGLLGAGFAARRRKAK